MILDSLRWLGLNWSEGPDVGGPHAPYRQSERMGIYKQYALELVEKRSCFYCFATAEELDQMRAEQQARGETPKYDGRGLKLSQEEVARRLEAGEPHVIRMKVPEEGVCKFNDLLRGEVEIPWAQVDMQVLLKTDGLPTYHLANVVDDHLMEITHVCVEKNGFHLHRSINCFTNTLVGKCQRFAICRCFVIQINRSYLNVKIRPQLTTTVISAFYQKPYSTI